MYGPPRHLRDTPGRMKSVVAKAVVSPDDYGTPQDGQRAVHVSPILRISRRTVQRLQWLSRRARNLSTTRLDRLEDSQRPLLFSLLPRMLHPDGTTPESLQRAFEYVDKSGDRVSALVASQRWSRAIATSRNFAASVAARGRQPEKKK